MKKIYLISLLAMLCFSLNVFGQNQKSEKKPKYDEKLAKKLGADELGMKTYVMVFLKRGEKQFEKKERDELVALHLKNIGKLAEEGKLILAGPFMEDIDIRGIYLFNVQTIEEAKKLTETDPAVKAGVFSFEMHLWYGSAALQEIPAVHKKIQKKSF
jgi:uncharacterized protein YciI